MRAGLDPLAVALAAVDGNEASAPELIETLYGAHAMAARRFLSEGRLVASEVCDAAIAAELSILRERIIDSIGAFHEQQCAGVWSHYCTCVDARRVVSNA